MGEYSIEFPNLGIYLEYVPKTISVFGFPIAYYGIIIAFALMVGILIVLREAKTTGQSPENYLDFSVYAVIFSIIGARMYYVAFAWDMYKDNLMEIFRIRNGGLAIYGGVIAAAVTLFIYAKIKALSFLQMADTACIGLVAGQIIGRWGNFMNREAFGGYTDGVFAMRIPISMVRSSEITAEIAAHITEGVNYIQVHPTFLYESLWNLGVLFFILFYKKYKKFHGEVFCIYLAGYGAGRFWIEALRTDKLIMRYLGLPVSQVLAIVFVIAAVAIIFWKRKHESNERLR